MSASDQARWDMPRHNITLTNWINVKGSFFFLKILWNKVGNFPTIFCLWDIRKPTCWFNFYKKNIKIYIKLTRVTSYSSGQSLFLASRECQMPHNPTIPWALQIYKASTSLFTVVGSQLLHNCLIITFSELTETKSVWEKFGEAHTTQGQSISQSAISS